MCVPSLLRYASSVHFRNYFIKIEQEEEEEEDFKEKISK